MDVPVDVQNEAKACLQLAEVETQSEIKVVLMGMAFGWLNLARAPEAINAMVLEQDANAAN